MFKSILSIFRRKKFPFQAQFDNMDCGSTCLCMISQYYGKAHSLEYMRSISYVGKDGVSLLNLSSAAEKIGFRTFRAKFSLDSLIHDCPLPCILHWNQNHFVVLYKIRKSIFSRGKLLFYIADPGHGLITMSEETFKSFWISTQDDSGMALITEPSPLFYDFRDTQSYKPNLSILYKYLKPYKKYFAQLIIGMAATSVIALIFPFLTQALIDFGIREKNIQLVNLLLFSQLFLFLGSMMIDLLQNWLILHMNVRLNLNVISDFLIKLMRLPIRFFDSKAIGDILQRINDHHRIETFLTSVTLNTVFSLFNVIVFVVVLGIYSRNILMVFLLFSLLSIAWILIFKKRRKQLDYKRFNRNKENQDRLVEMITGMQEIKLYGSERSKRWQWESLQMKLFKLNINTLSLEQYQRAGYSFLNQVKNILISFIAAKAVIDGDLSLGVMLSISYIIGQTTGPLEQLVAFIQSAQDAKLSLDRMNEIHSKKDEESQDLGSEKMEKAHPVGLFPANLHEDIIVEDLSFQYEGPSSPFVLQKIKLHIPKGKITAIVGDSGSGKTTLVKLLLGYYQPTQGEIFVGNVSLSDISPSQWRSKCGTVMQDGYIFSDTIANNIALDGDDVNMQKMDDALVTANIKSFVESYPMQLLTKIGNNGVGISGGQRQRLLIARAVYKDPSYLFLDEATSNLDANNERVIMDNLKHFFFGRSVVIIAHRLSTVKNADQIIVLKDGKIVEQGTHTTLTRRKGQYFELVKNQLELGV